MTAHESLYYPHIWPRRDGLEIDGCILGGFWVFCGGFLLRMQGLGITWIVLFGGFIDSHEQEMVGGLDWSMLGAYLFGFR